MKFKVGDKVKFINERGGGVVAQIVSPVMVKVAIDEGFEIPVMTSEIMPDQPVIQESTVVPGDVFTREVETAPQYEKNSSLSQFSTLKANAPGFYLAFVPQDQVWLLKDDIDIYFINHSGQELLYSMVTKNGNSFTGRDFASVEPKSKAHIATVSRDEIHDWLDGFFQLIFIFEESDKLYAPVHAPYTVSPVKFHKEGSYVLSSFLEEKSVLYYLSGLPEVIGKAEKPGNAVEVPAEPEKQPEPEKSFRLLEEEELIDNFMIDRNSAVVDLHLEKLVEDVSIYSDASKLKYQTDFFVKSLESAMRRNLKQVVFIHGVGIGRLKSEILKILSQYENLYVLDASVLKYGRGAIEVFIK